MRLPADIRAAMMIAGVSHELHALLLSMSLLGTGCPEEHGHEDVDGAEPIDVQALLWCVLSEGGGTTTNGEQVSVITSTTNRGACLCLPVGTQPYSGSELDELLHEMAIDKCEEDLQAIGAVTTNCAERVPERPVDYESICDPDDWPPPPI